MHIKRDISIILGICMILYAYAGKWTTHFAYNNVTQIAMTDDKVFALSDGSIYSVDKQSEQIRVYNNQSGLHGTGITCIHYDESGKQLIIGYGTGKIDILSSGGVQYISELYNKDMTQRKTIYNVTISGRTAYLATAYGIQTLDLRERKLIDSYWLRPGGLEIDVKDVLIAQDSIYAFTDDSLFCAKLSANLVDYKVWKREKAGRISRDSEKGIHYQDATSHWYAGHGEGIVRFTQTERLTYKPEGPIVNMPYRLTAKQGNVWVVPGGRWASQYSYPGNIMRYDGTHWKNITAETIHSKTLTEVRDFMNVAVDPNNLEHYYVTSYGTGLYEFDHDTLVRHDLAGGNNTLVSASASTPHLYTRLDFASYDSVGNLWFINSGRSSQLQCIRASGEWSAQDLLIDGFNFQLETPGGLIIDHHRPNHKWISTARYNTMLCLIDENGTPWDNSDDRIKSRMQWTDQHGRSFTPEFIFQMLQDSQGRVWLATSFGATYIAPETDFFTSDAIFRPDVMDNNGDNPIQEQRISAICEAANGDIWIGTEGIGVYVLNSSCTEIVAHYTTDNSAMPSNAILSLTGDEETIWIGTSEGLVEYDPNSPDEGLKGSENDGTNEAEEGVMQRWRLHLSYSDPTEIAATPSAIYAIANGSLFSIDRADDQIVYWSKANGLNGTGITHIAYDQFSGKLIIAYENGHVDLLDEDGEVTQMPDISMKAGSIALTINDICVGAKQTYLAMPFGIIAIHPRKGEVSDTYYIGADAASIEVQQIAEWGDTLYAFSYDKMYKTSLRDNMVDYTFWKSETLPCERVTQAQVWRDGLYTVQHDSLYRRSGHTWLLVRPEPVRWIHAHDGQMVLYLPDRGLYRLTEDDQLAGLTNQYLPNNALHSKGEYWLATNNGLVRLGSGGDDYFHTEGPNSNFGYCMYAANDRLYSAIGGRWATQFLRYGRINIYDGSTWLNIDAGDIGSAVGKPAIDIVSLAVDPQDAGHFFAATYGTGVFEFRNYKAVNHYTTANSTLRETKSGDDPTYYTRTDGAMIDEQGNLWVLNATEIGQPLHVRTPDGEWHPLNLRSGGSARSLETPGGSIWTDRRNSRYKWLFNVRVNPAVFLLDDGGTPADGSDDRCVARNAFVDQNGNNLSPTNFRCITQDHTNRIWIGTDKGILTIPSSVDFYLSNACRRIIIPRNDGTGLGDYLLGDEQINCLAVDGGNRMWIGTASSGLYLIEDDTITVAHFTETNSLLPSNSVQSIAIMPTTGEVFVGTDKGIASYRSDASEPKDDMSTAYAFPNPVRPDYGGYISITGLMENTVVNIVDAGGNLVCKTRSHGGTAVWDGKLPDGRRATPGVYSALCNAAGGHTVVKILVIR